MQWRPGPITGTVTATQIKRELAQVLRRVAAGEWLLITRYGKPVAMIGPPEDDPADHLDMHS